MRLDSFILSVGRNTIVSIYDTTSCGIKPVAKVKAEDAAEFAMLLPKFNPTIRISRVWATDMNAISVQVITPRENGWGRFST